MRRTADPLYPGSNPGPGSPFSSFISDSGLVFLRAGKELEMYEISEKD